MMEQTDTIEEIARLAAELKENPSDSRASEPSKRSEIIQAASKLQRLAEGPDEYLHRLRFQVRFAVSNTLGPYCRRTDTGVMYSFLKMCI